ncbi:hypothetical protein HJFPF1_07427 [Paramyrothecium foliicola]|nr:hypothetical protein HJFPF1_07427 [Paramyrothecium foliicola]
MPNVTSVSLDNPEQSLFSTAAKIPNVQHQSSRVFAQSSAVDGTKVEELLHCATRIDEELLDWADTVDANWLYTVAVNIDQTSNSNYTPHELHRYPSFYIARVWNCYRVSRLIVQSILLRANSWLCASRKLDKGYHDLEASNWLSIKLVNDICASVPFLLGHNLSKIKLTSTRNGGTRGMRSEHEIKRKEQAATGRFSLIWPLRVACGSSSVPKAQKDWIRLQLKLLAECGEARAHLAGLTESRILQGGSDSIRFDCV